MLFLETCAVEQAGPETKSSNMEPYAYDTPTGAFSDDPAQPRRVAANHQDCDASAAGFRRDALASSDELAPKKRDRGTLSAVPVDPQDLRADPNTQTQRRRASGERHAMRDGPAGPVLAMPADRDRLTVGREQYSGALLEAKCWHRGDERKDNASRPQRTATMDPSHHPTNLAVARQDGKASARCCQTRERNSQVAARLADDHGLARHSITDVPTMPPFAHFADEC
jgi:hypothetical protein